MFDTFETLESGCFKRDDRSGRINEKILTHNKISHIIIRNHKIFILHVRCLDLLPWIPRNRVGFSNVELHQTNSFVIDRISGRLYAGYLLLHIIGICIGYVSASAETFSLHKVPLYAMDIQNHAVVLYWICYIIDFKIKEIL